MNNQGWAVEGVDPNGLAITAGIQKGDRPVEINGQPAQVFLEKYEKVTVVFGMLIQELTVIDDNGQSKSVTLENSSPSRESIKELAILFIVCLIFWITGFYVYFKRPEKLSALLLCICGLFVGLALSANVAGERTIPTAFEVAVIASVIGPWLLLHLFIILPDERNWIHKKPLLYLIYVPAALTLILFPIIGQADGQPLPGFRSFRLLECGVGFAAVACVLFFNYFNTNSLRTRQQMKIVLISCLLAVIPFLSLNVIPGAIWRQTIIPSGFGILFIVFIPLGMGYAVVTHKLMDIDIIIRRSVVYGSITIAMAVVLSIAIFLTITYQESLGFLGEIAVALALAGIAVILFGPSRKVIEILVDKLFYKDRYDYRRVINSLGASLNLLKELNEISRLVVSITINTLNSAGCCLFVKTQSDSLKLSAAQGTYTDEAKQKQLLGLVSQRETRIEFPNPALKVDPDVEFIIPLVSEGKEIGVLCISPKASRQDYTSDDIYLLQGIEAVASFSLRTAMLIRDASTRETFISVASHELRTPLASISGHAQLLQRRESSDAIRRQWLKSILDNSEIMSTMIDELLNVSRIHSGKIIMKKDRVKLADLFNERIATVREGTDKHEFTICVDPNLLDAVVDHDKFNQVIDNLLSNAVKYSPDGGRITLSAHNDNQQHIVVSVTDKGEAC